MTIVKFRLYGEDKGQRYISCRLKRKTKFSDSYVFLKETNKSKSWTEEEISHLWLITFGMKTHIPNFEYLRNRGHNSISHKLLFEMKKRFDSKWQHAMILWKNGVVDYTQIKQLQSKFIDYIKLLALLEDNYGFFFHRLSKKLHKKNKKKKQKLKKEQENHEIPHC